MLSLVLCYSLLLNLFFNSNRQTNFIVLIQVGEAEKLVKTLFQVAISRQPSVIFMDEVCLFFLFLVDLAEHLLLLINVLLLGRSEYVFALVFR